MLHAHKDIRIREIYDQGAIFTISSHPIIMEQQTEQIQNKRIVFIYATLFQLLKSQTKSILIPKNIQVPESTGQIQKIEFMVGF